MKLLLVEDSERLCRSLERETGKDGAVVYDIEGTANGKAYEVEVTAAGKVLEVETESAGSEDADDDDDDDADDDDK